MKITITFNNEEKKIAQHMALTTNEKITEIVDRDLHEVGNYGEFKYDHNNNVIEYELKTEFIKATAHLIMSLINMVKSFISSCDMYSSFWLKDNKDLTKKEEETEPANQVQE